MPVVQNSSFVALVLAASSRTWYLHETQESLLCPEKTKPPPHIRLAT